MYVSVPRGFAGDMPAGIPCATPDACQDGLMCCTLNEGFDVCMTPSGCAEGQLSVACVKTGGRWNEVTKGCDYSTPTAPPAPAPVTPSGPAPSYPSPGGAPSVPGRTSPPPAAKPAPSKALTLGMDPLLLGAGVVLVGVVGFAATRKKKTPPPAPAK
jgi:hypothetical protein